MTGSSILVVDEAPINLNLIRLSLKHDGYQVRTATSAEDALQILSTYQPELVLADIELPGMSGIDMARRIKRNPETSAIRVIALAASSRKEDRQGALYAGCDDYINKPIDMKNLSARVREVLAQAPKPPSAENPPASSMAYTGADDLRRFADTGMAECRRLLDSLPSGLDVTDAAGQLHQWITGAEVLERPEISKLALFAEDLLREETMRIPILQDTLTELYFVFEELSASGPSPFLQSAVQILSGKRVALVGFTTPYADAICSILGQVNVRPFLFDCSDDSRSEAVLRCDLAIVNVRSETLESAWLRPGSPCLEAGKLVLAGERQHLTTLAPSVVWGAAGHLAESADRDEVLMRLGLALSRTSARPAAKSTEATAESAAAVAVKTRSTVARPSALLADDDEIVLTLLKSALENFGVSCATVDNGLDALQLIRDQQPHVAVLDVNMPGMDGYNVLAAVRAEKLSSRVILLTARRQEKDVIRAFELGADDYMSKPFSPFELVARLKRLLQ